MSTNSNRPGSSRTRRYLTFVVGPALFLIIGALLAALLIGGESARASGPFVDVASAPNEASMVSPTPCGAVAFRQVNSPSPENQNNFYGVSALSATAEERYLAFLETYPSIVRRVPQRMLAAYLGVSPETVSRIRKNLSRK